MQNRGKVKDPRNMNLYTTSGRYHRQLNKHTARQIHEAQSVEEQLQL